MREAGSIFSFAVAPSRNEKPGRKVPPLAMKAPAAYLSASYRERTIRPRPERRHHDGASLGFGKGRSASHAEALAIPRRVKLGRAERWWRVFDGGTVHAWGHILGFRTEASNVCTLHADSGRRSCDSLRIPREGVTVRVQQWVHPVVVESEDSART